MNYLHEMTGVIRPHQLEGLMFDLSRLPAKGQLGQVLILGQQIIQAARHDQR
jgi:hypothetical protein